MEVSDRRERGLPPPLPLLSPVPLPATKRPLYLETVRTVAFAENHHLVGINKLLYPRSEFILPGIVVDRRHFRGISVCLRGASLGRWPTREWGKTGLRRGDSLYLNIRISLVPFSKRKLLESRQTACLSSAPLPLLSAAPAPNVFYHFLGALDLRHRVHRPQRSNW